MDRRNYCQYDVFPWECVQNRGHVSLPNNTLVDAIHGAAGRAVELAHKVRRVGQWTEDAVVVGRVRIGEDQVLQPLRRVVSAPNVAVGQKEHLPHAVLFQTWNNGHVVS